MNLSNNYGETLSDRRTIDFDLHKIVRVRVIDPLAHDINKLAKQLGSAQTSLDQEPDIIIRFEENLSVPALNYLGLNSIGFTDEGFYILDKNRGKIQARIPFEQIGTQCEILCQSGLRSIPLLLDIIRLTFLKKDYIPLHASAFLQNDTGVLVMGWAKGGKTEMLLSFANHGAHYVGDEWVILSADGQKMFGIPVSVAIRDWHFKHIPNLLPEIGTQKKILFKGIYFLDAIHKTLSRSRWKKSFLLKILGQALPRFRQQLMIRESPQVLFNGRYCQQGVAMNKLFLIMSHSESDIRVEPYDPVEIAQRMAGSIEFEQMPFFEYYKAFKFAFPHLRNEFLEEVNELQLSLLCHALENKEAYKVLHPYPVSFEALYEQTQPFCKKTTHTYKPPVTATTVLEVN